MYKAKKIKTTTSSAVPFAARARAKLRIKKFVIKHVGEDVNCYKEKKN